MSILLMSFGKVSSRYSTSKNSSISHRFSEKNNNLDLYTYFEQDIFSQKVVLMKNSAKLPFKCDVKYSKY